MTDLRCLLRLRLEHGYHDASVPPMTLKPADPGAFERAGLRLHRRGAVWGIYCDADETPEAIEIDLFADSGALAEMTAGFDWQRVPVVEVDRRAEVVDVPPSGPATMQQSLQRDHGDLRIARLRLKTGADADRDVSLRCAALAVPWVYWITGADGRGPLTIDDPDGAAVFEELTSVRSVGDRPARRLRSRAPIALSARPPQRFSLAAQGDFGPETLVRILPAGAVLRAGEIGHGLQADIHVTLQ